MSKKTTTKTYFELWEVSKGRSNQKTLLGRAKTLGRANPMINKALSHRPDSKVEIRKVVSTSIKEDEVFQTI